MSQRVTWYCSCGSSASASSNPPQHAQDIVAAFRSAHRGAGHHEVDRAEFGRITRRQQREEAKAICEANR